jgi:hypothetical protein
MRQRTAAFRPAALRQQVQLMPPVALLHVQPCKWRGSLYQLSTHACAEFSQDGCWHASPAAGPLQTAARRQHSRGQHRWCVRAAGQDGDGSTATKAEASLEAPTAPPGSEKPGDKVEVPDVSALRKLLHTPGLCAQVSD